MDYIVSTRIQKIDQKKTNSTKQFNENLRYFTPNYVENRGNNMMLDLDGNDDIEFTSMSIDDVENMKKRRNDAIEFASTDYKENKGKSLPSNTNYDIIGVVTFGVDTEMKIARGEDELLDTLTKEEANFINQQKKDEYVKKYMKNLEKEYGVKILYCVRHSDEKTDHYHFHMLNYDYENHKTFLGGKGKSEMSELGTDLQDMVSDAFEGSVFKRGEKRTHENKKEKSKKHLSIREMHEKEIESLSKRKNNEREIKDRLDRENQATVRKYQMMKNDLDDYDDRKLYYQKELQNLKREYESYKNSDKMKEIEYVKKLKFTTEKLTNELNEKTEKVKKMDEIIVQKKGEYDSVKDLVAFLPKAYDEVEEEGFFLKKQIHAPAGYTFIKTDDYQKVRNAMIGIKKYEKENNCSINDVMQENIKLKREKDLMEKKHQNEINTIQFNAQKMINNITKQAKETYDEKVYELQCIINEQADNLKHFRNKVSDMMHTLKVKFGITEKDLNTDGIKFSKTQNDGKEFGR